MAEEVPPPPAAMKLDVERIIATTRDLVGFLPDDALVPAISAKRRKELRDMIEQAIARLQTLDVRLSTEHQGGPGDPYADFDFDLSGAVHLALMRIFDALPVRPLTDHD